ncbi:hypothetical protein [Pleurocapsa sp. PCC 7319]|uniref:hypothetical protein n=1 Tax=Pleurocapsa sp. PCC 7319 TaxID=118161 RepID=UPI00034B75C6|nr:hypothetical protein [Pleurocapsa sp. PCC 7319]
MQLLTWYEYEQRDHGQNFGFDDVRAYSCLPEKEYQELLDFHRMPHRNTSLSSIALHLLLNEVFETKIIDLILKDWDNYQLNLIPECNQYYARKFRQQFELTNWQEEQNKKGHTYFRFIGTLPEDPKAEAEAKAARYQLFQMGFAVKCRQILEGKLSIEEIPKEELVNFLTNEKELSELKENLDEEKFFDTLWAALALVLKFYSDVENENLDEIYKVVTETLLDFPVSLHYHERCQNYDLDASAFMANAAPRLLIKTENINSNSNTIFRCLIGVRDKNTSIFMASLLEEWEVSSLICQRIIQAIPLISRLICLTRSLSDANCDMEINRAWDTLEQQFTDDLLPEIHITDIFSWTPDNLEPFYQELPKYLKNNIDWSFAIAAYAPVINAESSNKNSPDIIIEARENVLSALLYERVRLYEHCKYLREEKDREYDYGNKIIYPAQETLISLLIGSSTQIMSSRINRIFSQIDKLNLRDFILVDNIIYKLRIGVLKIDVIETDIDKHIKDIAYTIGDFLSSYRSYSESELTILGDIERSWEELIELLTRVFQIKVEDNNRVDQLLTKFFNRFDASILSYHASRRKVFSIGSSLGYESFRKTLFKKLSKDRAISF